jgi:uncharacterized membrane protein YesL
MNNTKQIPITTITYSMKIHSNKNHFYIKIYKLKTHNKLPYLFTLNNGLSIAGLAPSTIAISIIKNIISLNQAINQFKEPLIKNKPIIFKNDQLIIIIKRIK